GQSLQIARVRGLILNMFGLLTQIKIEEMPGEDSEKTGVLKCRSRFFSAYAGRHVVKQLCEFIFETPDNILSGLHILSEILPVPLPGRTGTSPIGDFAMEPSVNSNGEHVSSEWLNFKCEARLLRNYWVKQL